MPVVVPTLSREIARGTGKLSEVGVRPKLSCKNFPGVEVRCPFPPPVPAWNPQVCVQFHDTCPIGLATHRNTASYFAVAGLVFEELRIFFGLFEPASDDALTDILGSWLFC